MILKQEVSAKQATLFLQLVLFALLSFLSIPAFGAQAARELKEIKIAYPPSLSSTILMTAVRQKFFEREGFRTTLLIINSNLGLTSQTVGEIDYTLFGAASGMVAVAQGMPIKIVHFGFNSQTIPWWRDRNSKPSDSSGARKLRSAASPAASDSSTRAILSSGGFDPEKDVTILQVGREDVRIQALCFRNRRCDRSARSLQALAEEKGYSLITDIEGKFEVPLSGLTATDKKLKENPEEVRKVIRALVDGGRFYMSHRAESVALYTDWLKLPKSIAELAYTRSLRFVSPDGLGKESTIKNQLDIVKKMTKKDIKQEDVIDFTLLKSILAENR